MGKGQGGGVGKGEEWVRRRGRGTVGPRTGE